MSLACGLFPGIFPSRGRRREFRQPLVQVLVIRLDAHRLGFDLLGILLYAPCFDSRVWMERALIPVSLYRTAGAIFGGPNELDFFQFASSFALLCFGGTGRVVLLSVWSNLNVLSDIFP